jgi:hypothetical protein
VKTRSWKNFMFGLELYLKKLPRDHISAPPPPVLGTNGATFFKQAFTSLSLTDWALETYADRKMY